MKNTKTCPKCQSKDILRLTDHGYGNMLATNITILGAVYMTRFICADCGFTEQWVESAADRSRLKKKYEQD